MKQLLTSYAQYEHWANERILGAIHELGEEKLYAPVISSFPSVHRTVLHMRDASAIWWQRVNKEETMKAPSDPSLYPMPALAESLLHFNLQWLEWIRMTDEADLTADLSYRTLRGDAYTQPLCQVLIHLSNHGTYHRGQLVTLLRQVGQENIPATDFVLFARS